MYGRGLCGGRNDMRGEGKWLASAGPGYRSDPDDPPIFIVVGGLISMSEEKGAMMDMQDVWQ